MSVDTYPGMETADIEAALEYFVKRQTYVAKELKDWTARCERFRKSVEQIEARILRRKLQITEYCQRKVVRLAAYRRRVKMIEILQLEGLPETMRGMKDAEVQRELNERLLEGVEDRIFRARRELAKRGKVLQFRPASPGRHPEPGLCDIGQ